MNQLEILLCFKRLGILPCLLILTLGSALGGESVDMTVSTPAIQKLQKAFEQRRPAVEKLKMKGHVGEDNKGLLAVRSLEGLSLSKKKEIRDQVTTENIDRRALYLEILKANGLSEKDAGQVMTAAAQAHLQKALPGHWVQRPEDGVWFQVKKK